MVYRVTEELETGNAMIDKEHQELFDAINHLLDVCGNGTGRSELAHTIQFLKTYTAKHFADEELLQLKSNYPDYANHHICHENYKSVVAHLGVKLNESGPTIALVSEVNTSLVGWLVNHIRCEDKKLAIYLQQQK